MPERRKLKITPREPKKPGQRCFNKWAYERPQELLKYMEKGLTNIQICAKMDISEKTFYKWMEEHPDFKEMYEIGIPHCESRLMETFEDLKTGKLEGKHSFNAAIAIANNKFKWTRGTQGESGSTNININNMNVLNSKNPQELLEFIKIQAEALPEKVTLIDDRTQLIRITKEE